jgi:hypothetical protein
MNMSSRSPEHWSWRALVFAIAGLPAGWAHAEPSAPSEPADGVASVSPPELPPGLELPTMIDPPAVVYPESLAQRDDAPGGDVVLRYTVSLAGEVLGVEFVARVHPKLDAVALEALLSTRHRPGRFEGRAVEVTTTATYRFEAPRRAIAPDGVALPGASNEASAPPDEPSSAPAPRGIVAIDSVLLEGGRRAPVANAADGLPTGPVRGRKTREGLAKRSKPAWTVASTTDAAGRFQLRAVPDGRVLLVFVAEGFERYEHVVEVRRGRIVTEPFYATRMASNPYRTVVTADVEPPVHVAERRAKAEETSRIPGSRGDALVGLQNFPGMARTPFGLGALVIRGAAPGDSAVYLGGHEIPQLFHFGGLKSTFNSELIEEFAYVPSNFDAKFGDATGGLVDITPRGPRRDGIHGYGNLDLVDVSAMLEGKVGRGGFAVAGRRSHLDLVLRAIDGVAVAPRYWDYQGLFDYPIGPGTLTVRAFGSGDRLIPLQDVADGFEQANSYHRVDVAWRQRIGRWSLFASPSYLYETEDSIGTSTRGHSLSARVEARWRQSSRFGLVVGTETRAGSSHIELDAPPQTNFGPAVPGGGATSARTDTDVPFVIPAVYATANLRLGDRRPLTIAGGLRVTAYAIPMTAVAADPRLGLSWQVDRRWTLQAASGLYSQSPELVELDENFGNPDLLPEKSWQNSIAVAVALPRDISLQVTGFYKVGWDLVSASDRVVERNGENVLERFASGGRGRSFGGELLLRREFSKRLYGWVAYTLSRTQIRERSEESFALAAFDQTHILTLLAGVRLPRNWTMSTRFRLTSGNPTTPQRDAVYDVGIGQWTALAAPLLSDRLPTFHQLDLRVDKTWTLRRIRILGYFDVQNLYNARNAEFISYSFDSRASARITSLSILPTLGLRIDW